MFVVDVALETPSSEDEHAAQNITTTSTMSRSVRDTDTPYALLQTTRTADRSHHGSIGPRPPIAIVPDVSPHDRLATPRIHSSAFVADTARIFGAVTIGSEVSIWFGVVIRCETSHITIGARSNVQDNAVLHADVDQPTEIGEDVTIGHGAIVHAATVGDGALIGMGAVVLNGARIGRRAMIAAGSVVAPGTVVEEGMLALGSPARTKRPVRDEEWESTRRGVDDYRRFAEMYGAIGVDTNAD